VAEEDDEGGTTVQEEEVCEEGAPLWVVTFGDMMSLLLTFFILLLSFATMDAARFRELSGSIRQAFGIEQPEPIIKIPRAADLIPRDFSVDFNTRKVIKKLKRDLSAKIRSTQPGKVDVQVFETYRGVVLLFPGEDIFEPGTDRLRRKGRVLLDFVAGEAQEAPEDQELVVEARAKADAPRAPQFQDAWALTAAQSVSVATYLREQGGLDPVRLRPVGRGPAPPNPRTGRTLPREPASTVEFLFLSPQMHPW